MKIILASIFAVATASWSLDQLLQDGSCRMYDCSKNLANGKNGTERQCADWDSGSSTVTVEPCGNTTLFQCLITPTFTNSINCSAYPNTYPVWRNQMAAGDTCYGEDQCFGNMTCGGKAMASDLTVCLGQNVNETCSDNRMCNPGLYCDTVSKECRDVIPTGGNCTATLGAVPCSFANSCYNGTCTPWGQVDVGNVINIPDPADYDGHTPFAYNEMFLCKSFFALPVTGSPLGNYVCAWGDKPLFDSNEVKDGNTTCYFNRTNPYDNTTTTVSQLATCGYNKNSNLYCPKTREESYIRSEGYAAYFNENKNMTCNLETSFQYCGDVENNAARGPLGRLFMAFIWRTTGTNFAQVADNPYCITDSVTQFYWHILAGSFEYTWAALGVMVSALVGLVL